MYRLLLIFLTLSLLSISHIYAQISGFQANVSENTTKHIKFSYKNLKPIKVGKNILTNALNQNQLNTDTNKLPRVSFTFCVPHGAKNFQIKIQNFIKDSISTPTGAINVANEENVFKILSPYVQRGINLVTVFFSPFTNSGNRLKYFSSAEFILTFESDFIKNANKEKIIESSATDNYFSSFVLNYFQSDNFRVKKFSNTASLQSSNSLGLEECLLLQVPQNAVYYVTANEAKINSNGSFDNIRIEDIRLRNKNDYLQFYIDDKNKNGIFDNTESLIFYGKRNQESAELYYSEITDTNIYILTWHGGAGKLDSLTNISIPTKPASNQHFQDTTLHFEKENIVFMGHTLSSDEGGDIQTIHRNERVFSERYYWGKFGLPGDRVFNVPFDCYPSYNNNKKIKVKVRLIGNSLKLPSNLIFRVNDYNFPERFLVKIYSDTTLEFSLDQRYFLNGRNNLLVVIDDTLHKIYTNELYFDYLELQGNFRLTSNSNQFKLQANSENIHFNLLTSEEIKYIANEKEFAEVTSTEKGFNFQVTSRQLEGAERAQPTFCIQSSDTQFRTPAYLLGFGAAEIDYQTGKILKFASFDLYNSNAEQEANRCKEFINSVKAGNYIILGSATGGNRFSKTILKNELERLGATKILASDDFVSSWIFATKVGGTEPQEYFYTLDERPQGIGTNIFFKNENGNYYNSQFSVSKNQNENFVASTLVKPLLRYHNKNEILESSQFDMIIISNPYFMESAKELAKYRTEKNKIKTKVINVVDIYNEFNFGIKSPDAIRNFCDYAYKNYPSPKPSYLLLFGDASWDVAHRLGSSQKIDLVPSFGHPVADYMFGVSPEDTVNFVCNYFVGRLPVSTVAEGFAVANKLIEYDTLPPADWHKRFLFVAGGTSESQVGSERAKDQVYADLVLSNNYQGDTAFVHRTDKDPQLKFPTNTDGPWLRSEVNKGVLHWSFTGHGSIDRLDLDFGDAEDFDNANRYYLVSSFSCQTGDFADPVASSKTERMITIANKGAVAAMGNTSYSYTDVDAELKTYFYEAITHSPLNRSIGAIALATKYKIIPERIELFKNKTTADSIVFYKFKNHLLCHSLMGDPSMNIITRSTPELVLRQQDLIISNQENLYPTPLDSVMIIKGKLWNFGMPILPKDSIIILRANLKNSLGYDFTISDTVRFLTRSYDFQFQFSVPKSPSDYTLTIHADPNKNLTEEYLSDNILSNQFKVIGNQPIVLEPTSFGHVVGYENIKIRLINPPSGSGAIFWLDTTDKFDNLTTISSNSLGKVIEEELTTEWQFSIPTNWRNKKQFWWKAISTKGDTGTAKLFPLVETFNVVENLSSSHFILSDSAQLSKTKIENLIQYSNGIGAGEIKLSLRMQASGQTRYRNGEPIKQRKISIKLGSKELRSENQDGVNIILFDKNSATFSRDTSFAFYKGEVKQFLDFVKNEIKENQIVVLGTCGVTFDSLQYGSATTVQAIKDALISIGCTYANKLRIFDSYCLVGGKNNSIPVKESYINGDSLLALGVETPYFATLDTTLTFPAQGGTVTTPVVGSAVKWDKVSYNFTGNTPPKLELFGFNKENVKSKLQTFNSSSPVDISNIDANIYPKIELTFNFPKDTIPRLSNIAVSFQPAPELALRGSTCKFLTDSVLQGDTATLFGTIINLSSKTDANNILANVKAVGEFSQIDDSLRVNLRTLDSTSFNFKINTTPYNGHKTYVAEVNTNYKPTENYKLNNKLNRVLKSVKDVQKPEIEIYADGNRLMSGDFVSPKAKFSFKINDNSKLRLNDSLSIKLVFDRDIIRANSGGAKFVKFSNNSRYRALFEYQPTLELSEGQHELKIIATDATQNSDTTPVAGFLEFNVSKELQLNNVVNYPNPFSDRTDFTFIVGAENRPTKGSIKIFTLSGKKIRTIELDQSNLKIGFNKIEWNGKDEDNHIIANGVYLYKITVESILGEKQEVIEKLAIVK